MYIGRIVALLTPVFAGLAGWLTTVVAENFPGAPNLDSTELTALFVAGALAAVAPATQWLKGLSKHEENEALKEMASPRDYQGRP